MVSAITFAFALCLCQTLAFARARLTCALIASDDDDDDDDGMEWNGMESHGSLIMMRQTQHATTGQHCGIDP